MSNQSTETEKIKAKDDQTAALIAAQVFIVFSAIYWFMQLESVRELLLAAPKDDALEDVHETLEDLGLNPEQVRVAKLGPNLLLEARMIRI